MHIKWSVSVSMSSFPKVLSSQLVELAERQKARKNQREEERGSPADFIWGKSKDVNRNISGKIGPRRRRLYSLDHGAYQESHDTYFSIADKMVRCMPNLPARGRVCGSGQNRGCDS